MTLSLINTIPILYPNITFVWKNVFRGLIKSQVDHPTLSQTQTRKSFLLNNIMIKEFLNLPNING